MTLARCLDQAWAVSSFRTRLSRGARSVFLVFSYIFTFSLFPYVYLLSRLAFMSQSSAYYEIARLSGSSPWNIFSRIAIPLSRPAIVGGIVLVSMETLADYGVVDYLGINTFTKGIFRTW